MKRLRPGSMLMEAVIAVPVVLMLFLACFQFIFVAYARLMVEHAAQVAVRVAEVTESGTRNAEALAAAQRILTPVSWSYNSYNLDNLKSNVKNGSFSLGSTKLPANDFRSSSLQPDGWFPIWGAGWIEDQVSIKLEEVNAKKEIGRLFCEVSFKCPLHVPIIAQVLRTADGDMTVDCHGVPSLVLKGRSVRILTSPGLAMPTVQGEVASK